MKRFLCLLLMLSAGLLQAQDSTKVSELTEATDWDSDDLAYIVVDPSGSPLSRKITLNNLLAAGTSESNILVAATDSPDGVKQIANYTCDGTDDEVQINAAIAALPAQGGTVMLGPGNFVAEGIDLAEAVYIRGCGMFATKISLPAGAAEPMFVAPADAEWNGGGLFDMELYGDAGYSQNCVDFSAVTLLYEFNIERCKIHWFAVGIRGAEEPTGDGPMDRFLTLRDCLVWNCTTGMTTNEHPRIISVDFRTCGTGVSANFSHCQVEYSKFTYCGDGIAVAAGGQIENTEFVNCVFYDNTNTSLEVTRYCTVSSCLFLGDSTDASAIGLEISGSSRGVMVNGCTFGTSTKTFRGGTIVFSSVASVIHGACIIGNQFYLDDTGSATIGIKAASGSNALYGTTISGNFFFLYGNGTCAIDLRESSRQSLNSIDGNVFAHYFSTDTTYGVRIDDAYSNGNSITNNVFYCLSAAASVVALEVDATQTIITGNKFKNIGTPITLVDSDAGTKITNNSGYVTENSGTATVASGQTTIDVTHGLAGTPTAQDVQVTPTNNLGNAAKFWISDLGATTFRINVNADPGATTATFSWRAELY